MDIRCLKCLEPWDLDTLHEAVAEGGFMTFDEARKAFQSKGCGVAFAVLGQSPCTPSKNEAARSIVAELALLSGDDIDGFASDLEDAEYLGLLD